MTVEPESTSNVWLRIKAERMRLLDNYQTNVILSATNVELIETSKNLCAEAAQLRAKAATVRGNRLTPNLFWIGK